MNKAIFSIGFALATLVLSACGPPTGNAVESAAEKAKKAAYRKEIMDWRQARLQSLQAPNGWLSLVGMHWLEAGNTRVGSAADNGTRLDVGPPHLGIVKLEHSGALSFDADPESGATVDGQPDAGPMPLISDVDAGEAGPTVVGFNKGDASFIVIKRGGRYALRVRDVLAPSRSGFPGLAYFDIDPSYRFEAKFTAHPPGTKLEVINILSMVEPMDNPGTVSFTREGKVYTLEAVDEGDGELFLIFADRTSGHESYSAARYLYAHYPDAKGMTVVDFNKAYNPPCALTAFATCPLPPAANRLDLAIRAGELKPLKNPLVKLR
jgi:uncharacterized protein (DUF1684 family)